VPPGADTVGRWLGADGNAGHDACGGPIDDAADNDVDNDCAGDVDAADHLAHPVAHADARSGQGQGQRQRQRAQEALTRIRVCWPLVVPRGRPDGVWGNWQPGGFWLRYARFESWYPSEARFRASRTRMSYVQPPSSSGLGRRPLKAV